MKSAQCPNCVWRRLTGNELGIPICSAFPAGIPVEIMTGEFDHTKPYPGDGGIRYLPGVQVQPRSNSGRTT